MNFNGSLHPSIVHRFNLVFEESLECQDNMHLMFLTICVLTVNIALVVFVSFQFSS